MCVDLLKEPIEEVKGWRAGTVPLRTREEVNWIPLPPNNFPALQDAFKVSKHLRWERSVPLDTIEELHFQPREVGEGDGVVDDLGPVLPTHRPVIDALVCDDKGSDEHVDTVPGAELRLRMLLLVATN